MAPTIMIVDDEKDTREIVGSILKRGGLNVIKAKDADECIKKIKKHKPDLILLDIRMPGLPGHAIVEKLRKFKVIYLSTVREEESKKKGYLNNKNVIGYIEKPFELGSLLGKVKDALHAPAEEKETPYFGLGKKHLIKR